MIKVEIGFEANTVCNHTLQVINQVALGVERVAASVPLLRMISVEEGVVYWYTPVPPGITILSKERSTAANTLDNEIIDINQKSIFLNIMVTVKYKY
jgi:hypothetical protein